MTKALQRYRNAVEPLAFLLVGILCAQLSRDKSSAPLLAAVLHPDVALLHQLFFYYGLSFLGLALASYILGRDGQSLIGVVAADCMAGARRLKGTGSRLNSLSRSALLWLGGALLIGIVVRGHFLDQPMRYDESFSFLHFVYGDYHRLFYYDRPNNHVLNTILEKLSCWLIGPTPVGIRLPAFLCGIGLIPLSFVLSRKLAPGSFGILAAYGVALFPYLILFSSNGRGYSMVSLAVLLIVYVSLNEGGTGVTGRWALPALLSALGMLTMPSMAYALAGLSLWITGVLALQFGSLRNAAAAFLLPYAAVTAMLTLVLYTPVVWFTGSIGDLTANEYVRPLPTDQFVAGVLPHLSETIHDFVRDVPSLASVLVTAFALVGIYAGLRERNRALALLLPAMLLGSLFLFVLKKSIPFPRTWIYMIPLLLIYSDVGLSFLSRRLPPSFQIATPAITSAAAIWFAWQLIAHDAISTYPDTGRFSDAAAIAGYLSASVSEGSVLCGEMPSGPPLAYYLWRDVTAEQFRTRPANGKKFFVHPGPLLPSTSWGSRDAKVLLQSPDFVLYDWTNAAQRPQANCWAPSALYSSLGSG